MGAYSSASLLLWCNMQQHLQSKGRKKRAVCVGVKSLRCSTIFLKKQTFKCLKHNFLFSLLVMFMSLVSCAHVLSSGLWNLKGVLFSAESISKGTLHCEIYGFFALKGALCVERHVSAELFNAVNTINKNPPTPSLYGGGGRKGCRWNDSLWFT